MKVDLIEYYEDTGVCILDLDKEAQRFLLEKGFNTFLSEAIENMETKEIENGTSSD